MIPTKTQSAEHNIQVATPNINVICSSKLFDFLEDLINLAQIITFLRLCAYDTHGKTSRSWLFKGQEVHIHVHCGKGFSCQDCFVEIRL
jgi:hypothetical protein